MIGLDNESSEKGSTGVPTWLREPFQIFRHAYFELVDLVTVTKTSISRTQRSVPLAKALAEARPLFQGDGDNKPGGSAGPYYDSVERAKEEANIAASEVRSGFRLLHSNTVVLVWAYLETLVDDLLVATIRNNPGTLGGGIWEKIRVPVGQVFGLSPDEQAQVLADYVFREIRGGSAVGSRRLETVLECAGLSGQLPDDLGTDLYVLHKVRNLVAHRGGVIDRRFREECRMLDVNIGKRLMIGHHTCGNLLATALRYHHLIYARACDIYGGNAFEWPDSFKIDVVSSINSDQVDLSDK